MLHHKRVRKSSRYKYESLEPRWLLAAANYDSGFGAGGTVNVALPTSHVAKAIAQADGTTLIAGSLGSDAFVERFSGAGALDTTFGTAGLKRIDLGGTENFEDMVVLSDGDILAGGNSSSTQYLLVRLNSDGSVDTGFGGGDGIVTGAGQITAIATNGSVLFSAGGAAIRKHTLATGALDGTFGSGGTVSSIAGLTKLTSFTDNDLAVRADGRPLLIGIGDLASLPAQGDEDFVPGAELPVGAFLVSLTTTGAADNSFDTDAVQALYLSDGDNFASQGQVALDAGGNIFSVFAESSHGGSVVLSRYNPSDGQLVWSQSQSFGLTAISTQLLVTSDGIVIGAPSRTFFRYDASGNLDTTFNGDGSIVFPNVGQALGASTWTADGKLLIVDDADAGSGFTMTRVLSHADTLSDHVHLNSRGTLLIYGTSLDDALGVRLVGHRIRVSTNSEAISFSVNQVKRITANLFGGSDLLKVYETVDRDVTADGGAGNNTIVGGAGNDSITGGSDSDVLYGGSGNDTIAAGDNNDSVDGGTGADVLSGGLGALDTISFSGDDAVHLTPDGIANDGAANEGDNIDGSFEFVIGTAGNDYLVAGSGSSHIEGRGGDDTIFGGPGDDGLFGGDGRDRIYGGGGADRLEGNGGSDWLHADGDGASDTLVGGHDPQDRLFKDDIDVVK